MTTKNKKKDKNQPPKVPPVFIPRRKRHSLIDFLMMTVDDIYHEFSSLPGATIVGEGQKRFLYVPPTREESVLLVAHADTVWDNKQIKLGQSGHKIFSTIKGVGTGADDRCGIALLWKLRKLGHALLIPDGEEKHGLGSAFLMEQEEWRKKINSHLFAVEMDRMGNSDLAFYDVASTNFKDWCEKQFVGYKRVHGMWTDICFLCDDRKHKEDCLDGVNISVGYYRQHSDEEYIEYTEWQRTLSLMHSMLKQEKIPKFHHAYEPPKEYNYPTHYSGNSNGSYSYVPAGNARKGTMGYAPSNHKDDSAEVDILSGTLVCPVPECEGMMDEGEYRQNKNACIYCNKGFDAA